MSSCVVTEVLVPQYEKRNFISSREFSALIQPAFTIARKGTATGFNALFIWTITCPFDNLSIFVVTLFVYAYGTDLIFGRCFGMMIAGSKWIGEPTWRQKLIYCTSYSVCFALLFCGLVPFLLTGTAQIVSIVITGKTTHGLLASMDSEYSVSS